MRLFRNLGLFAVAVLPSLPARAEEGGLPQLDASLFPEQVFWLAVTFGVLYILMSSVALPRVAKTQANRKQVIASEVEAARAANDAARAAAAAVDKALIEARAKAQAHVGEMIAEVAQEETRRQAAQEKELSRRLHHAEADIAVTREAALKAIGAGAADLAALIVDKTLNIRGRGIA